MVLGKSQGKDQDGDQNADIMQLGREILQWSTERTN